MCAAVPGLWGPPCEGCPTCVKTMLQWIRAFLRATWMPCCQTYPRLRSPQSTPQVMHLLCRTPLAPAADDKPSSFSSYHTWHTCALQEMVKTISSIQLDQCMEPVRSPQNL